MDPKSSFSNTFDLNSQKGVMALLAAVRQSSLSNAEKNELRDLVFLYTNGGGDVSVKIALEQKLRTHQIQPLAPVTKAPEVKPEPPRPPLPFGSSRPAPVFAVPVIPKPAPKSNVPETKTKPAPVPVVEVKEEVKPAAFAAETTKVVERPEPKSNPVPEPKVVTAPPVQNTNVYLDRIREIKSAVNSQVGNPVNLVDIDNQVGREYMTALLEAMKRLSGGQPGGMEVAMSRLETAYAAVEKAVANHQQKQKSEPVPVVSSVPVSEPQVVTKPVAQDLPVRPTPPPPPPPPPPIPEIVTQVPVAKSEPVRVDAGRQPENSTFSAPVMSRPVPPPPPNTASSPWSTPADLGATTLANNANPAVGSVPRQEGSDSGFSSQPTSQSTSPYKVTSVLEEKKNLTPQDLPAMSSAASRAQTGDPLFTPEIEAGLGQLLSDWSLFKKSGLFGTGPKGKDHPLYKQIADLQIPLLLAGRFEGSTQEIKQSITDYMNGWRYEQGIIYEKGETFERYLRRVIKQILDLQKKRLSS